MEWKRELGRKKKAELSSWDKQNYLLGKKTKREIIAMRIYTCMVTKQVMHKRIAHHLLTDAQQWLPAHLTPLSLSSFPTWCHTGISLWLLWVCCPGSVPSHLRVPPVCSSLAARSVWEAENWDVLGSAQCCSRTTKVSVCYLHSFSLNTKTWHHTRYYERKINSVPSETRTPREVIDAASLSVFIPEALGLRYLWHTSAFGY